MSEEHDRAGSGEPELQSVLEELESRRRSIWRRFCAVAAIGAAVAIGIFFIVMDRASDVDPLWAALLMRFSYCVFLLPVIVVVRPSLKVGLSHLPGIVTLGVFDAIAGVVWAIATTMGMLSLVSVLGSLYPAVTVILASVILHEKPQSVQLIGIILAISGVALISAG